jgi:DNA-binding CsgD family transcriptional regulator
VYDRYPLILDREAELATVAAALTAAADGHGTLVLLQGPAGIGKTTVLRAACTLAAERGQRTLTARGLALEQGFSYGIVRQLLEPVRATAGPGEWDELLGGAARLARRVFDGSDTRPDEDTGRGAARPADRGAGRAERGDLDEDVPHATVHGLYWLTANLAAGAPLVITIDDAHWADTASLRWLSHLAARMDDLPIVVLLGARSGPDQPELLGELRDYPACVPVDLRTLGREGSAALVRDALGARASAELCHAAYAATGGNPFLLDALLKAMHARGDVREDDVTAASLGPQPVADAVVRRIGRLGAGAVALARALAVLGRPAPLRHVATLADMDLPQAALLTDGLREADVLGAGAMLEFEHPIVRTAIYDSVPPGMRAIAHARAAALLDADGADVELVALHLLRSEPAGDLRAVTVLRAAAASVNARGAPDAAVGYLRRALAEPPPAQARAAILLDLGVALASDRDQAAVEVLRDAVAQAGAPGPGSPVPDPTRPDPTSPGGARQPDEATAALLAAGVLGVWGHHDSAAEIAMAGLSSANPDPLVREHLEAELLANSWPNAATAGPGWQRIRPRLAAAGQERTDQIVDWHVYGALSDTLTAGPGRGALQRLAPALAGRMVDIQRDSLTAGAVMLVLTWNDELTRAMAICDAVLADAHARGSMNMIANVGCLRSMILGRLGVLHEAADAGHAGLDFKLKTSPPLAVAWTASFLIEALARIGRFAEAEQIVAATQDRHPPDGWIHTIMFIQARGGLRVAQHQYEAGLADLWQAAAGWRALGVSSPAAASWRVPAVVACAALGREQEAARLAAEQLELARQVGTPLTLGVSLRVAAPFAPDPERALDEAITLLEAADSRYEQGVALAVLGAHRRRAGRRAEARDPLRRALDCAEHTGAQRLRDYAHSLLLAVGARPRRAALTGPESLTAAERQVAALAADGKSNRQIAQQLFITQATVETHLRHAFAKLGITSRADLPAQLTRPGTPDS